MPSIPEEILEGCRPLEEVPGLELLSEAAWCADLKLWCIELSVTVNVPEGSAVPSSTRWHLHLSPNYPLGTIDLLPDREGGLTETFHHQLNNSIVGVRERPWRPGKICLDTGTAALDRHGEDPSEPRTAAARLPWHLGRAKLWLGRAAKGELVLRGEPFELPDYRPGGDLTVLFREDSASLSAWRDAKARWGNLTLKWVNPRTLATTAFTSPSGETVYAPAWGERVSASQGESRGVWLLASEPIATPPWQAPMTWGELREQLSSQGIDLMTILEQGASSLRDGESHLLLLGYPIPLKVGGELERMHWIALALPILTKKGARIKGFRNHGAGLWSYDCAKSFRPDSPLRWAPTENGSDPELTSRGSLDGCWCEARVLCIGAGALGSAVAELLVRGGVRQLVLCDSDDLKVGNLVRHTLTATSLGENKAEALATRLNDASPNAHVRAIAGDFPPTEEADRDVAARVTVIIDCSANDEVLHQLSAFPFETPPASFHLSLGGHARRLFLYGQSAGTVDPAEYLDWIDPWLALERREFRGSPAVRPSAGCHHPAFPARPDHVWLLAATATSWMNELLAAGEFAAREVFARDNLELTRERLPGG